MSYATGWKGSSSVGELDRLAVLLSDLEIGFDLVGECLALSTKPVFIREEADGLRVVGWGYMGVFRYSAEWVARMLDRKFKAEMAVA
jgi:hypothetical protein